MKGASVDPGSVVFDRYRLEERIGAGGMGVVWRATDLLLDQPVALKRICLAGVDDTQAELTRDRALREARLAARLRHHRHVVATYDVRVDDGDVWLVLEYVPCRSLAHILRDQGPMIPGQAARIGAQVADALAAAHALGIEHRDVTPGNVLITHDGAAKLTDFGISHLAGDTQLTKTEMIAGTVAYLAPEVAKTGRCSPASDVFSLGSTLYSAIEGQPPFGTADNVLQLLSIVGVGIIRPPTAAGAFTPLLMRLLELDPATRLDAATARDLLDEFATQVNVRAGDVQATTKPPRRWSPRHPVAAVLAVIALAALAVGAALVLAGGGSNAREPRVPPLPSTVGPVALIGDPRAADPCALIDLAPLRQFGQPSLVAGPMLESCEASIATPNGDVSLSVWFSTPVTSAADLGGTSQQLDGLTIVRQGNVSGDFYASACQNVIVLTDRTRIYLNSDLCAITEVGTAIAVNALARDGISYRPDRTSASLFAGSDACALLDGAALSRVEGLDSSRYSRGFANWSCTWGASGTGNPQVFLLLSRYEGAPDPNKSSEGITIAGRPGWVNTANGNNNSKKCAAFVVSRPARSATAATEIVRIDVDAPGTLEGLCARATELVTTAVAKLPSS